MIDLDPSSFAAAISLCDPLNIRTIVFDMRAFDPLKRFQGRLRNLIRRNTGNAEVLRCLIHTQPEMRGAIR